VRRRAVCPDHIQAGLLIEMKMSRGVHSPRVPAAGPVSCCGPWNT
jgi:hypothetical protein